MKSATDLHFGEGDNCGTNFPCSQPDSRHARTVIGYGELNPVRTSLIGEDDWYRWIMTDGVEYMVNGAGACGSSSPAAVDQDVRPVWASWTVTMPPHNPGCDSPWALGPTGFCVGRRRGPGQGSLEEPDIRLEAVGRASGTDGKRHRYSLTGTVLRVHLHWAECGLRQKRSPGSRVLEAACRTGTASAWPDSIGRQR
jgi:hypothetical protein